MSQKRQVYSGVIAGLQFGHFRLAPHKLKGRTVFLAPEPTNEYDPKAIAVMTPGLMAGTAYRVGFIPRKETRLLHKVLETGGRLEAEIREVEVLMQYRSLPALGIVVWGIGKPPPPPLRPAGGRRIIL